MQIVMAIAQRKRFEQVHNSTVIVTTDLSRSKRRDEKSIEVCSLYVDDHIIYIIGQLWACFSNLHTSFYWMESIDSVSVQPTITLACPTHKHGGIYEDESSCCAMEME